jgi:small nuclear ribonucleoprotein G
VLDDAVEEKDGGEKVRLGMVVCYISESRHCYVEMLILINGKVIRGNSVVMLEALERIGGGREDRG